MQRSSVLIFSHSKKVIGHDCGKYLAKSYVEGREKHDLDVADVGI